MVAKFSARSWLNRIRWARNSASASISLITPAMGVSPVSFPAGSSADSFEFSGKLVEAHRDEIRVFRDAAGGDVLDSAGERQVDVLVLHDGVDGRGERRQEPIDLPVPVGELLGNLAQHRPQRIDGFGDRGRRHGVADALQLFTMRLEDLLPELYPQVRGGTFVPGSGQEAGQPAHVIPFAPVDQGSGQGHRTPHHLRPQQPGLSVGVQELRPPVTATLGQIRQIRQIRYLGRRCRPGEDAHPPGGLQQFPGEEEQVLALRGQLVGSLLVSGQQPVGRDGRLDCLPQGKVRGRGDGPLLLGHARLHFPLAKASWAKAYREAVEYGLNFSTCSAGHSVSRYRARSSSRLAAADTPSSASLSAGDSTRSTARRPKKPMPARRSARSAVAYPSVQATTWMPASG